MADKKPKITLPPKVTIPADTLRKQSQSDAEQFKNNGDPMGALFSFLNASEAGSAPPENIMKWLTDVFRDYVNGKESMDTLMGLNAGRGRALSPRERFTRQLGMHVPMDYMFDLITIVRVSIDDAAAMVETRLMQDDFRYKYSAKTLAQYWHSHPAAKDIQSIIWKYKGPTPKEVLEAYPEYCWPLNLKERIK